jgi:hypothetical protein
MRILSDVGCQCGPEVASFCVPGCSDAQVRHVVRKLLLLALSTEPSDDLPDEIDLATEDTQWAA